MLSIFQHLEKKHKKNQTLYLDLVVGGGGFEPPKASPTDLQSAPFDRSGIPPFFSCEKKEPMDGFEPPTG